MVQVGEIISSTQGEVARRLESLASLVRAPGVTKRPWIAVRLLPLGLFPSDATLSPAASSRIDERRRKSATAKTGLSTSSPTSYSAASSDQAFWRQCKG